MSASAGESALVVLAAALDYVARGWSPVPIPHREKGPLIDAWQDIRVNAETAAGYFNEAKQKVGIILGKASGGLTDLDIDCPEAIAAAPYILPRTAVFGWATKPATCVVAEPVAATRIAAAGANSALERTARPSGGASTRHRSSRPRRLLLRPTTASMTRSHFEGRGTGMITAGSRVMPQTALPDQFLRALLHGAPRHRRKDPIALAAGRFDRNVLRWGLIALVRVRSQESRS